MSQRHRLVCAVLSLVIAAGLPAQQIQVPLYPGVAPGSEGKTASETVRITPQGEHIYASIHHPSLTVYLPAAGSETGVGVLVIPGGGHSEIWMDHEGFNVAEWLSKHGIAAFVLKYRLAREPGSSYTIEGTELADTQRAIRLIRSRSSEWKLDSAKVGVMGFSAGGELAALASTRSTNTTADASDPLLRQSSRPAFQALLYPALPKDMALSENTPPAFLACGEEDAARISEGVPALYLEMKHVGMPVELHIFAGVGHGFGIRKSNPANVSEWPQLFYAWLQSRGLVAK